jgi:ArsR family transcriptional regulator, zinc-responsive transcriptional repressor
MLKSSSADGPVSLPVGLTDLEDLGQAAECLRTLAHPHRLRMVQMMIQGQYTVGELAQACEIPSASASLHLRKMQSCGLLSAMRDGQRIFYEVADPSLGRILDCIVSRFG